jgi:hypothetical protein
MVQDLDFTKSIMSSLPAMGASSASTMAATTAGSGIMGSLMAGAAGGPVGMVASMVLGGIQAASDRRKAISDQKVNQQNALAQTGYAAALEDWYKRKDKGERRMGLENYNQFNTMEQIAPGYKDVYKPAALGAMPNSDLYVSHRNQKVQNGKIKGQEKAGQATVGSVTVPGG